MRHPEDHRVRRVLGYARVSSREQALGTSLQDQQNALKAYAEARGLKVEAFFVEAESAVHEKFERREKMQQLMAGLRAGDLVLCDKLDRWSRDPEFTYRSMREARERGARVYFVGEQLDPTTPEGDSLLGLRVMMAREEHKRIRLRMVGTRKLLRNQGFFAEGLPPFGYQRQLARGQKDRSVNRNMLVPHPKYSKLVPYFYKLSADGWSIDDIRAHATKKYPERKWDKKKIGRILRNRAYLGEIRDSQGAWIKAAHPPLLTPQQFTETQAAINSRRLAGARPRAESRTRTWLLRGLASCMRCGAKMASAYKGGVAGKGAQYYVDYYMCRLHCGARLSRVDKTDPMVSAMVLERLLQLRETLSKPAVGHAEAPRIDYSHQRANLEQRRDRLLEARLDGHLSRDEFNKKMARIDDERTRIDAAEAEQAKRTPAANPEQRRSLLRHVSALRVAWERMPPERRREVVKVLAASIRIERDKRPVIEWRPIEEIAGKDLPGS